MYLGVDLGTSAVKLVLTGTDGSIIATESFSLDISRPKPLWSEQDPNSWWNAFCSAADTLSQRVDMSALAGIGLSGQMHGAVLLDAAHEVIRPAILWNDGRSSEQCAELERVIPECRDITGNMMMPGFTAPKLLWVKQHEPEHFEKIAKVLLPKDYLRFKLSGDFASDQSDSAGTLWLNTKLRQWDEALLNATGLTSEHMPTLFEGNEITGVLHQELAERWGIQADSPVPIIAGGGDNAAGAIGVGLTKPGQAMISLGTSGVYFLVTDSFSEQASQAVHSFCHALPNRWHLMSVLLSAASCLEWFAENTAVKDIATLFEELDSSDVAFTNESADEHTPLFLPYLSGERTPHNNPKLKGCWIGLTHGTSQLHLLHSVLEGVSLAFADGVDALHESGAEAQEISVIGGGARSSYWRQMLADVLNTTIVFRDGGDVGPGLGAARLAQLALEPERSVTDICPQPDIVATHSPREEVHTYYQQRRNKFKSAFASIHNYF